MEAKKYYIREIAFGYNDEYMYEERGFGDIKSSFYNLEEATKELKRLTFDSLRGIRPEDYEPISYCHKDNNEEAQKLDAFIQANFGRPFLIPATHRDGLVPDRDFHFPSEMTKEQAWEVREVSGIKQYEIIEVSENGSSFWGIQLGEMTKTPGAWLKRAAVRFNNETREQTSIPFHEIQALGTGWYAEV